MRSESSPDRPVFIGQHVTDRWTMHSALVDFGTGAKSPYLSLDSPQSALPTCNRMASEHTDSLVADVRLCIRCV